MVLAVVLSLILDCPAQDSMPQMLHKPPRNKHVQQGRRPKVAEVGRRVRSSNSARIWRWGGGVGGESQTTLEGLTPKRESQ